VLKLLIVADDPLARAGLALLLASVPECEVVGQIVSADVVDELMDADAPDAVIWDFGWELPANLPNLANFGLPVVALLPDGVDAPRVWAAGFRAILTREADVEQLITAARTAVQGLVVLDPDLAGNLLPVSEEELTRTAVEPLTPREREVLQLVAEGLTNKAIARQLHISDHTVKFHVNALMGKLGAQSRTEAVVRATRLGLLLL
jgi:DNA-binding NarL/FixJ family response regulator